MSALLCGIDQVHKVALPVYKAQDMPDRHYLDIILIMNAIYEFFKNMRNRMLKGFSYTLKEAAYVFTYIDDCRGFSERFPLPITTQSILIAFGACLP